MEWQKVWESLVASGPLALVCGAAVVVLWKALQDERKAHIDDLKSLLKPKD